MKNPYVPLWLWAIFFSLIVVTGIWSTKPSSAPCIVLVRALDPNGVTKWSGSGCFIRKDLILTAGHIVANTQRFEIVFSSGKIRPGYFEYQEDPNLTDVGLVRVHGDYPIGRFGHVPHLGQDVWIAGYALAERPLTLTRGIVSCIDRDEDFFGKIHLFQTDFAAWPGHSGSPILDKHNQIIGLWIGYKIGSECWSLNVPVQVIRLSLAKYDATRVLCNYDRAI